KEEIKGNQNGEESDDKTERTIKNLRITSATPLEQNTELLPNDEQEKNGTSTTSSEIVGDDGIKFIGKGINSVIDGIHKVKDNEV
ncbi:476_t:CDS:2, partial [Dentiscutata erythropus]